RRVSAPTAGEGAAGHSGAATFGGNEWLIESQYEAFKSDPESVGESWREFFASYTPPSAAPASNGAATASEPKADAAPAPRAEPATSAPDRRGAPRGGNEC